jgi:Flp pilus assembly protein TadG
MNIRQNFSLPRIRLAIQRWRSDKRGSVAIMVGFMAIAFSMMLGLVVEEAQIYRTTTALKASTAMAALAAAQDINCCTTSTAIARATSYGALNPIKEATVTMVSGYPKLKCLTSTGVSCAGTDSANAIVVSMQATIPLVFGGFVGQSTKTITATATAGVRGGVGKSANVMLIVDTTASMNTSDPGCSVSGATRLTCAEAGARTLLQAFNPSIVSVGLMVFPGVNNTTSAGYDYACSGSSSPTIASYAATSPLYQIVGFSTDYKTSPTATTLNASSNLVKALGGGGSGCKGLQAIGGYGTYYAGVIAAAQAALVAKNPNAFNVIIFLSDGDANASSSNVPSGKAVNQCHEGITAAQAATTAGTAVYTAAYGAPTGKTPSSCSTDTGTGMAISACTAMQSMASTPSTFFSDTTGTTCTSTITANSTTDLVALFNSIAASVNSGSTGARLLSNDVS